MGTRRFKRIGLNAQDKAKVVESIKVAREGIVPVELNYYYETPEYQAANQAGDAMLKLAQVLTGDDHIFRGKDAAHLAGPLKKKD